MTKRLLGVIACASLFLIFLPATAQDDARAQWQIAGYDITANVLQAERALAAVTTVTIKNTGRAAGSGLTLRLNSKAKVSSVSANGGPVTFHSLPDARPNLQRLNLTLTTAVAANSTISLAITYRMAVDANTGLESISAVGAQFRPESFWYPVINTSFTIRGVVPGVYRVEASGPNLFIKSMSWNGQDAHDNVLDTTAHNMDLGLQMRRAPSLAALRDELARIVPVLIGRKI